MPDIITILKTKFPDGIISEQITKNDFPTLWVHAHNCMAILYFLKKEIAQPYTMLYDLTAIDEQARIYRDEQPDSRFTIVYQLLSFQRNTFLRLKIPLTSQTPSVPSITSVWPSANWYEREVYDLFGVKFTGHPDLRRILMPNTWVGHPLQKCHPARATEMGPFHLPESKQDKEQEAMKFKPEEWGLNKNLGDDELMFLNLGPQHPGTHGILRLVVQLDGEDIVNIVPDIGFHHRGAEKMGERQSWHSYIPYTDRVEYLGGVMNNFPYVMAVEKLAGIEVPERVKMIRIMMSELFRISSHLVWYGTFAQDLGMMTPVFLTFNDREKVLGIVEAICGARMHPNWFRIGGVTQDLPKGWEKLVQAFIDYFPKRLKEYDNLVMKNSIFKARTVGIGVYTTEEAIEWGITGPGLRATGFEWDFRKKQPYSGYQNFDFDVPIGKNGDCYDRAAVRVEEMRQSLRIIQQCVNNMPEGPYKSNHPLTTPPLKEKTLQDIETLIHHFINISLGPVIPAGEAFCSVEATKGNNGYYLISDGNINSYRTRIRTPSFPHMQLVPEISRGYTIPDLMAILGSVDYVLSDIDR
ncbi:MAG: NADH-quinone oxidoreductase subunit C/D [Bacteroidia bacterium]